MTEPAWEEAQRIARKIVVNLGGWGLFGVECFVKGDEVIFSEVSPRPHDTGLVTLGSQVLSEFALHARSILGLPIPEIRLLGPAHSVALLGHLDGVPLISGVAEALAVAESQLRLFGKPECRGHRRLGVAIASGETPDLARERARAMASCIHITALE
jgi:phosphoribosylglycinamide formyltransferase 2